MAEDGDHRCWVVLFPKVETESSSIAVISDDTILEVGWVGVLTMGAGEVGDGMDVVFGVEEVT